MVTLDLLGSVHFSSIFFFSFCASALINSVVPSSSFLLFSASLNLCIPLGNLKLQLLCFSALEWFWFLSRFSFSTGISVLFTHCFLDFLHISLLLFFHFLWPPLRLLFSHLSNYLPLSLFQGQILLNYFFFWMGLLSCFFVCLMTVDPWTCKFNNTITLEFSFPWVCCFLRMVFLFL